MAQAVNQNNLVDIINSTMKESDAIVNMVNSIVSKLANVKAFDASQAEKVKKSIVFIGGYIQDISSMIISLMDDEAINLLADESIQTDEGVKQLKLVKAVNNISSIISSIDKVFKEVSQLDMGLTNILFFKLKIKKVIPNTFSLLLTEMTNIFNSISAEGEIEIKKLENKFKTDYIKSITDLFSSIGALNEIKMPNIINIKLNLIIFKRNLVRIVEFINSMFDNKKTLVTASRLSNVDALSNTVKTIFDTVNIMYKDSAKILIFGPLINRRLKKIIKGLYIGTEKNPGLVILLYEAISNEKIKAIVDKSKQLADTNLNIRKLITDLSKILLMINLFTPFVTVGIIVIPIWRLGLTLLKGFVKQLCGVMSGINLKKFQDSKGKITLILGVINQLSIIFTQLTLFAPIVITGMIASLIWIIGLYALKWVISIINKVFKIKLIMSASTKLNTIALLLQKIAMIFTQLTILLPIIVLGMIAIPIWMIGLLLLLTMIFVIKLFINIAKKAITVKSFIALITLQIFLTMLSFLIIQIVITSAFAIIGTIGAIAIIAFLAVMIAIILAMTGIGYLVMSVAPFLLPVIAGFGIIFILIGLLTLTSIMLNTLALIKLDKDKILNNVDAIINTARTIIDGIFGKVDEKEDGKSKPWYQPVINLLGIGGDMIKAILAVPFLSLTIISVSLISFLAIQLRILQTLNLDNVLINKNISTVINAAQGVANAINTSVNEEGFNKKTGLGKLVKVFAPRLSNIADAISSVGFIAITSISIGMLANLAQNLQDIEKFNVNDSIITEKVNKIISTSQIIVNAVLGSQENGLIGKIKAKLQEANATNVIKKYRDIVEEIAEISRVSWNSIDEKTVKNNKSITDNYIQFVEKINKVDIKKLETSANMFEKMADFSKSIHGNFEKLAESINEDLMPVLEELKETLNKIPDKIDTNAASVSQSISANAPISNQPSTPYGMTQQVQREYPGMTQQEVSKMVDSRLNEQARAQSQSLESKFDELIELLKSGMARVSLT